MGPPSVYTSGFDADDVDDALGEADNYLAPDDYANAAPHVLAVAETRLLRVLALGVLALAVEAGRIAESLNGEGNHRDRT